MLTFDTPSSSARSYAGSHSFPPITHETRPVVNTEQAAFYLGRKAQTLRVWAMRDGSAPIRPLRINGRLAWPVDALKVLLGVQK